MTTITNFIQGNFVTTPSQQSQTPFWVLDGPLDQTRQLIDRFVQKCIQDNKPLIHLDIGLRTMRLKSSFQAKIQELTGQRYLKLYESKPYYMIDSSIKQRTKMHFLDKILENLEKDLQSGNILKDKQKISSSSCQFALLVEGLQAWHLLNQNSSQFLGKLQAFTTALARMPSQIRQIVVPIDSQILPVQINFSLERSSTCLTKLLANSGKQWTCISTVRRFTGYSKQQEYIISLQATRVKVSKQNTNTKEGKTSQQKEMLQKLGFVVEKDAASKEQEAKVRQMIYPHLKMRGNCSNGKCNSQSACKNESGCKKEEVPEDLIVLDDQQQDQDDIDV